MRSLAVWLGIILALGAGALGAACGAIGETRMGVAAFFSAAAFSIVTIVADVWLS